MIKQIMDIDMILLYFCGVKHISIVCDNRSDSR